MLRFPYIKVRTIIFQKKKSESCPSYGLHDEITDIPDIVHLEGNYQVCLKEKKWMIYLQPPISVK